MPATRALTVAAEIDPERLEDLREALTCIADELDDNPILSPADLPDTHFTRWVVVEDEELPALLVWESNHDGRTRDYLERCAQAVPRGLDRLFGCCRGYPAGGASDPAAFAAWATARSLRAEAFYCAYRGISKARIGNDRAIHDRLRELLDQEGPALARRPMLEIAERLRAHVGADPALDASAVRGRRLARAGQWALALVVALLLLVPVLLVLVPWFWGLRRAEEADAAALDRIGAERPVYDTKELREAEDHITQNQLTHLVDIKPGWFRFWTLRAVLFGIDVLARLVYVNGELGGIRSIHFARWVILKDSRTDVDRPRHRLLFFSNYDGSWESYLGEFIDRAASGLTGVWSNTCRFPRTRALLGEGARDEEAFKQWTRDHQIPTQVWWSGVPDSTVDNVRTDLWIRDQLARRHTDPELTTWLRTL